MRASVRSAILRSTLAFSVLSAARRWADRRQVARGEGCGAGGGDGFDRAVLVARHAFGFGGRADEGLGGGGFGLGGVGCGGGFAPSGEHCARFGDADLRGDEAVGVRQRGLGVSGGGAGVLVEDDLVELGEIGFGGAEFAFGVFAADVEASDPGGFLQHCARRSEGLAAMTAPILPWLTSAGECAPVAASAKSRPASSRGRRGRRSVERSRRRVRSGGRSPRSSPAISAEIETSAKSRGGQVAVPARSRVFHAGFAAGISRWPRPSSAERFEEVRFAAAVGADATPVRPGSMRRSAGSASS